MCNDKTEPIFPIMNELKSVQREIEKLQNIEALCGQILATLNVNMERGAFDVLPSNNMLRQLLTGWNNRYSATRGHVDVPKFAYNQHTQRLCCNQKLDEHFEQYAGFNGPKPLYAYQAAVDVRAARAIAYFYMRFLFPGVEVDEEDVIEFYSSFDDGSNYECQTTTTPNPFEIEPMFYEGKTNNDD
jgi:hypothetical protein